MKRFDLPFGLSVLAVAGRTQDAPVIPAPEVMELAP
jgi:hypothetical protein